MGYELIILVNITCRHHCRNRVIVRTRKKFYIVDLLQVPYSCKNRAYYRNCSLLQCLIKVSAIQRSLYERSKSVCCKESNHRFEKAIIGLSEPKVSNCNESSSLTVELLRSRVSTLEKLLIGKDAIINFLLTQNEENHESSLAKADATIGSNSCNNPLKRKMSLQLKRRKSY